MNILQSATTKLGNKIELIGEAGEGKVLVVGVFHGDEPQGKYLIDEYLRLHSPSPHSSPQGGEEGNFYFHHHNYTSYANLKSKELRQNLTDAENILWTVLRRNQINNLHFKRQKPIGKYIVDFICREKHLIIEIDGGQHNQEKNIVYDCERTRFLESYGYKVIRFWNNEIDNNIEGVYKTIMNALTGFDDRTSP